jgi:hypothetical protein
MSGTIIDFLADYGLLNRLQPLTHHNAGRSPEAVLGAIFPVTVPAGVM